MLHLGIQQFFFFQIKEIAIKDSNICILSFFQRTHLIIGAVGICALDGVRFEGLCEGYLLLRIDTGRFMGRRILSSNRSVDVCKRIKVYDRIIRPKSKSGAGI